MYIYRCEVDQIQGVDLAGGGVKKGMLVGILNGKDGIGGKLIFGSGGKFGRPGCCCGIFGNGGSGAGLGRFGMGGIGGSCCCRR